LYRWEGSRQHGRTLTKITSALDSFPATVILPSTWPDWSKFQFLRSKALAPPGRVEQRLTQARNQLGSPGGAKSFLRGAQIFRTMSNNFNRCPIHFTRKGKKFSRGASQPLGPPYYGPGPTTQEANALTTRPHVFTTDSTIYRLWNVAHNEIPGNEMITSLKKFASRIPSHSFHKICVEKIKHRGFLLFHFQTCFLWSRNPVLVFGMQTLYATPKQCLAKRYSEDWERLALQLELKHIFAPASWRYESNWASFQSYSSSWWFMQQIQYKTQNSLNQFLAKC